MVEHTLAKFLGNQLSGDRMASDIPMAITDVISESMQKEFLFLSVRLQLGRKRNYWNTFTQAQLPNPVIRIEEVLDAKPLHV